MDWSESILENKAIKVVYFAVLLACVIVIVYLSRCWVSNKSENLEQKDTVYSAGATMRFAQELSATDQIPYETGYNFELRKLSDEKKTGPYEN